MRAVSSVAERSPPMSAPAQNERSPAPVMTMQRQSFDAAKRSQTSANSAIIARDIALRLGWLSIVTNATCRAASPTFNGTRIFLPALSALSRWVARMTLTRPLTQLDVSSFRYYRFLALLTSTIDPAVAYESALQPYTLRAAL